MCFALLLIYTRVAPLRSVAFLLNLTRTSIGMRVGWVLV